MTRLNLKSPALRKVRNHPALIGKPLLARGFNCAVFDNGGSVLKLTQDSLQFEASCSGLRLEGINFPVTLNSYGDVGEAPNGNTLHLFEVEKLSPVSEGPAEVRKKVRRLISSIHAAQRLTMGSNQNVKSFAYDVLEVVIQEGAFEEFNDALDKLSRFASLYSPGLDFHMKNIMLRGTTVIFNDVFTPPPGRIR